MLRDGIRTWEEKSNNGEAEIAQETSLGGSGGRTWSMILGESGGTNCSASFCLGFSLDEKSICQHKASENRLL